MSISSHSDITQLLLDWSKGDQQSLDKLLPVIYQELRRLAQYHLQQERSDHTLQATALVHEAYLKLIDAKNVEWQNRAHFFAVAAQVMRHILVDMARQRHAQKRGGGQKFPLDEVISIPGKTKELNLIELDEALERLAEIDPQQSRIVELRYFGGLSVEETAEALEISPTTVKREWRVARAWLKREISQD